MSLWKNPVVLKLLIIILAAVAVYGLVQYKKASDQVTKYQQNPQAAASEQTKALVAKVGTLMTLPSGETPTVATITDIKKLKDQPFFAKAKNGDKVLIYTQAKKAILFRESENKIIDVASVNIGQTQQMRIALYNGTSTTGATTPIENLIKQKVTNAQIVLKDSAKETYTSTIVVDLTGNQKDAASQLAQVVGGQVGSLPNGETKPANADFLIIVGSK